MPRCFMAKKLKYPYEQWKEQQIRKSTSRSPSPVTQMSDDEEEIDLVGLPADKKQECPVPNPASLAGKLC